jgi:hypothetical protein
LPTEILNIESCRTIELTVQTEETVDQLSLILNIKSFRRREKNVQTEQTQNQLS